MIKQIDDELYQVVCEWWKKRGWPVITRNMIGPDMYVAFLGEKPIMSAVFYKAENSSFGMLEWINSNPESTWEERDQVFDGLIEFISELANKRGVGGIQQFTNHKRLKERLVKNGFVETDQNLSGFFKITCGV